MAIATELNGKQMVCWSRIYPCSSSGNVLFDKEIHSMETHMHFGSERLSPNFKSAKKISPTHHITLDTLTQRNILKVS